MEPRLVGDHKVVRPTIILTSNVNMFVSTVNGVHHLHHGNHPLVFTKIPCKYDNKTINFTLFIDNFGVIYIYKAYVVQLQCTLKREELVTIFWGEKCSIGIFINWDHSNCRIDLLMPGYIQVVLHKLQHTMSLWLQDAPFLWSDLTYKDNKQPTKYKY